MSGLFGGGDTQQSTSQTNYASWIPDAQKNAYLLALAQNFPAIMRSSEYSHAGFNPDQQMGFDQVRDMLSKWGVDSGAGAGAQGYLGQVGDYIGRGSNAQAAQLGPTDFRAFMNPYLEDVLVPATNELQRQTENARTGMGARLAAGGAYGGSRQALGDAQLDRQLGETGSRLVADTMAAGFDKAQQLAEGNTNRRQQTNMQNANNAMQGANTLISTAGMFDNLLNSDFNRNRSVIGDLLSTGAFQQEDMQSYLNEPLEALARLFQFTPQQYDYTTTGTQPDNSPSLFQQLLGGGLAIAGLPVGKESSVGGKWLDQWINGAPAL